MTITYPVLLWREFVVDDKDLTSIRRELLSGADGDFLFEEFSKSPNEIILDSEENVSPILNIGQPFLQIIGDDFKVIKSFSLKDYIQNNDLSNIKEELKDLSNHIKNVLEAIYTSNLSNEHKFELLKQINNHE